MVDNPYEAPSDGPDSAAEMRRPLGVSILAVLTLLFGLLLLALYLFLLTNWQENNEHLLRQRKLAPSIFWVTVGLFVVLALGTAVGMWRGAKWSWWTFCSAVVLYVLQNFVDAAAIVIANGAAAFDLVSAVRLVRSLLLAIGFALLLRYWLGLRVRKYFHFEKAGGIKAILLSGLGGIGIVLVMMVVLQAIFMVRMRFGA